MQITNNSWHVVYTYPKQERKIFQQLSEKEIPAYLPSQKVIQQWSDRKKSVEVLLFPNYVFVKVPSVDRYKVLSVPGVTRFIFFDGKPAIVSEKEMAIIKLISGEDMEIEKEDFCQTGDKVRVLCGPLAGLKGRLMEKKGRKRFAIRFDSITQVVSVEIQAAFLEKIS